MVRVTLILIYDLTSIGYFDDTLGESEVKAFLFLLFLNVLIIE